MVEYTKGLRKFEVPDKLTLEEAVGVFEVWKGLKVFGSGKQKVFVTRFDHFLIRF